MFVWPTSLSRTFFIDERYNYIVSDGEAKPAFDKSAFYVEVGRRIANQRVRLNKTQDQLAEAVDLSRTSLTNIERGKHGVMAHTLHRLADELRVSASDLLPEAGSIDATEKQLQSHPLGEVVMNVVRELRAEYGE